jgi:P27 family predicted phage terminase small subunit
MGNKNSGPRPRPTVLKILRGTARKDRLNPREPVPPRAPDAFDTPPDELQGDALALSEWTRVVPMLRRIGLVSEAERSALIAMCQQWSRYLAAQSHIRTHGMVVVADGKPILNPYLTVADRALGHCQKLWVELGLTPSGRSRMATIPDLMMPVPVSKWTGLV